MGRFLSARAIAGRLISSAAVAAGCAALTALLAATSAAPAYAQAKDAASKLKPDLSKIYGKDGSSLEDRRRRALEKLYGAPASRATVDPRDALKLKPNRRPGGSGASGSGTGEAEAGAAGGPDISRYSRLDSNNDGGITVDEYLSGRSRQFRPGGNSFGNRSDRRQQVYNERLGSQFRAADSNHDGRITKDELKRLSNPRF